MQGQTFSSSFYNFAQFKFCFLVFFYYLRWAQFLRKNVTLHTDSMPALAIILRFGNFFASSYFNLFLVG